jgi:arginine exporter protein ArgO|tara:strand:- start:489 stop:824 length:336 start_codon:yes stop_codon:yes gene_type:complete
MISNTIESLSQFICTSSGIALAGVGVASQSGSGIISESTLLPLSLFIGGIAFTATLTWRASSAKANLAHQLERIERRLDSLEQESGISSGMETKIDMAQSAIKDYNRRKRR